MPTSPWRPRQTRDVPFSPNSITPTSPKLPRPGKFRGSRRNRIWAKWDVTGLSRNRRGRHGEVGIVEFGLNRLDIRDEFWMLIVHVRLGREIQHRYSVRWWQRYAIRPGPDTPHISPNWYRCVGSLRWPDKQDVQLAKILFHSKTHPT